MERAAPFNRVRGSRLAALSVIALTATACSKSEPAAAPPPSTQRQPLSTNLVPIIEKLHVEMLTKETSGSNARLLASVSPNSTDVIAQGFFTLKRSTVEKGEVMMTDDGQGADDTAGDLVFSGFVDFDFDELLRQNDRIKDQGGPGNVVVTRFDGRLATATELPGLINEKDIVPGNPIDVAPLGIASAIAMDHSIVITDVNVVRDPDRTFDRCNGTGTPMGVWTFGHLFQEMVNPALTGLDPRDVAQKWMETWLSDQEIHFASALKRPAVQTFIDDWMNAAGTGQLELKHAPFRLVAIVNRMDLHDSIGYGGGSSGETRFVFALEDAACNPLPFLVIFEYGNIREDCDQMTGLARQWVELGNHPVGSPMYNDLLQKITDEVVTANAAPSKPNGSALNQLRTNDFVFDRPWQLREFMIDPSSGELVPDTVKRTPDISLDATPDLDLAIDDNLPTVWPNPPASMINILTGSFDPLEYPAGSGIFIRAMASDIPSNNFCFQANLAGNGVISGPDARFEYSSNTCSGCHGGDVNASGNFTHIDENGNLSNFLSGPHTESDCMTGTPRNFDEPTRRAQILDALANNACERLAMLKELNAEH